MHALCLNQIHSCLFCSNSSPIFTITFPSQLCMFFFSFSKNPLSPFSNTFICMGVRSSSHDCILKKKKKTPDFSSSSNHKLTIIPQRGWDFTNSTLNHTHIWQDLSCARSPSHFSFLCVTALSCSAITVCCRHALPLVFEIITSLLR